MDAVANLSGPGTSAARGIAEVDVKMGLLTPGYVGMKRYHSPFLVVEPPSYAVDAELARHFSTFAATLPKVALSVVEYVPRKAFPQNPFEPWPIYAPSNRPYFGVRDDEVHFSASTCKTIALVTATILLAALRRFAEAVGLTIPADKLLGEASAAFRDDILTTARAHPSLNPASDTDLLPNYAAAFSVTSSTATSHTVDFSASMLGAINEMMKSSHDPSSQTVIHNTGLGYIHGALTHLGLFDAASNTGLWLAGDYEGARRARRIPAVNDTDTAQGATTRTLVALLDMALDGSLPNTNFLADKFALSRVRHPSWLTRPTRRQRQKAGFHDKRGKIGDEDLKSVHGAHRVYSEVIEFQHEATERRFLVSYQNARSRELPSISDLIFDGLASYIKATAS